MDRISKKTVATSRPFRFLVGPGAEEFTIHSALLAHQSHALSVLVEGKFKESEEACVKWDDIDPTTFTSFWQFVYSGDYDTPEPLVARCPDESCQSEADKPLPAEEPPATEPIPNIPDQPEEPATDIWRSFGKDRKKERKKERMRLARREILWNEFQYSWPLLDDQPREVEDLPNDHTDPVVHHARVYVLGDRYGIVRLMNVSFDKLHQTLIKLVIDEGNLDDIVALVQFCFQELVPERLKQLIVHYVACNIEQLWKSEKFQELSENCGGLSRALIGSLLPRLN